jgi:hypothetical protein
MFTIKALNLRAFFMPQWRRNPVRAYNEYKKTTPLQRILSCSYCFILK